MGEVLKIENLTIEFDVYGGQIHAVRDVSLSVEKGEIVALVGESGCGKSVTAQAVMNLNPMPPAKMKSGRIFLCGQEMTGLDEGKARACRGKVAGMVFQNPMTALNPTMKIGKQITESLFRSQRMSAKECQQEAIRLLEEMHIPNAAMRANQYPHELSGGMRQRVMIAMALAGSPELLIADEPTTALDVTIQLEILRLLYEIREEKQTAILFITHDLSVVANLADRVAVMYAGKIVEEGEAADVFRLPAHPYTKGLLDSLLLAGHKGVLSAIGGTPPDLFEVPNGCAFAPRCVHAMQICRKEEPPVFEIEKGHTCACWRHHPIVSEKETAK